MNITIAEFEYTKANGDVSDRTVLILSKPSDSYFGIELDDPNDLSQVAHYLEYLAEREKQDQKLRDKFGITGDTSLRYRRFKEDGIDAQTLNESVITV